MEYCTFQKSQENSLADSVSCFQNTKTKPESSEHFSLKVGRTTTLEVPKLRLII